MTECFSVGFREEWEGFGEVAQRQAPHWADYTSFSLFVISTKFLVGERLWFLI